MAGSRSQSPADDGVRRRHSSVGRDSRDRDNASFGGTNTAGMETQKEATTQSSGSDVPGDRSASTDRGPSTLRFSEDLERRRQSKRRKSDEDDNQQRTDITTGDSGVGNTALRIDTAKASGSINQGSPDNSRSPSPNGRNTRSESPMSPRGRNRGMSLRSSLFTKQMGQRQQDVDDSIIEMGEVGSANTQSQEKGQSTKGKDQTSVTVSPLVGSSSLSPDASRQDSLKLDMIARVARPTKQRRLRARMAGILQVQRIENILEQARRFILRIHDIPPSKDGRHISLDPSRKKRLVDDRTEKPFINNTIRSSKYNAWNFLPRQLFAQFSKLANFYFLCVSILQMIPGLSTTGTYTTIVPLLFFVSLSMAKEGLEDFRRYKLDKEENNRYASVLHAYDTDDTPKSKEAKLEAGAAGSGPLHWAPVKWHNLRVGDVVKLTRDEAVPADIVLLHSNGPNDIACIETMALDGETNLKNKQPSPSTSKACSSPEGVTNCKAHFVVEDPNLDLYNFEGKVTVDGKTSPLTNNEIVYRGSVLRNTPDAIGMIIYSGEECKIRMNANKNPRIKAPTLQSMVNKIVIMMVVFVVVLSLGCSGAYELWNKYEDDAWYLRDATVPFGPIFTSFVIMFNTLIPLSLYVSLEIVKVAQMLLLNDVDMYDEESNTPFDAKTSTINEELGQVSYIFSDKTGTLTENVMRFRKMSVAGTAWTHDVDLQGQTTGNGDNPARKRKSIAQDKGKKPLRNLRMSMGSRKQSYAPLEDGAHDVVPADTQLPHTVPSAGQFEMNTMEMLRYIQRRPHTMFAKKAKMLILSIALCHTCLPERSDSGEVTFQASSPPAWRRFAHWSGSQPEPYQDSDTSEWSQRAGASSRPASQRANSFQGWYARKKKRAIAKLEIGDALDMRGRVLVALIAWAVLGALALYYALRQVYKWLAA